MNDILQAQQSQALRDALAARLPDCPTIKGWKSFSQCDEDGIVRECLERIARVTPLSQTFVEIGCGNGLENNTHQLLLDGYSGIWVDGSEDNIRYLSDSLSPLDETRLALVHRFLVLENACSVLEGSAIVRDAKALDFLSLDIDGNDAVIVDALLGVCAPKLLCVEYNAKFPPPSRLCMPYCADHVWDDDDYFGASLQYWVDQLSDYLLVACSLSGANAFFVRKDLVREFTAYSASQLYQPPRYWLCGFNAGHPPSLKWLRDAVSLPV